MGKNSLFIYKIFRKIPTRGFLIPPVFISIGEPLKNGLLILSFDYTPFFGKGKCNAKIYPAELSDFFIASFFLLLKIISGKTYDNQSTSILLVQYFQVLVLCSVSAVRCGVYE